MYRKQVRRRRAVLAVLVAASIALLTMSFGNAATGPLATIQRGIATVASPVVEGADRALKPVRDLFGWVDDTASATKTNKDLRDQLAEARRQLAESKDAQAENTQLRKLVDLEKQPTFPGDYTRVTARVIARSPTVWYSQVTIDKGRSAGVHVNDPVVTGDGLAGHVSRVTSGTSVVQLIADPQSAVSATVAPDKQTKKGAIGGVVKSNVGNPDDLLVDFIEKGRTIKPGWTVTTAGWKSGDLESVYPPGIPVGKVSRANIDEQETYRRVHIEPYADLRGFEVASVLTGRPGVSASRGQVASTGQGSP